MVNTKTDIGNFIKLMANAVHKLKHCGYTAQSCGYTINISKKGYMIVHDSP